VKKKKRIEELIESLFEAINISTNDSQFVQEILKEIEDSGFTIQMRFIVGVIPSASTGEKIETQSTPRPRRKRSRISKKIKPRLTKQDQEFLDSLGLGL